ncbi:MAG: AMP-binding protein, partial [Thermoanaerobaculia bacterium]
MTPRTLVDIFRNLADTPKPDLLLVKQGGKWNPISTMEFMDQVKAVSSALGSLGVKQGGRVALLSENRPEWSIVDFACQCYGAVLVPIFPTMVTDQVAYLLKDSGATVAFASTSEQAAKIL